ncbi:unnamed protein product [Ophioblennius macclurei]
MDHDLECGICYKSYNGGRRGPRELTCKHTFCESCVVKLAKPRTLSREQLEQGLTAPYRDVTCPLCRRVTVFSEEEKKMRDELQVNLLVVEQLRTAGLFNRQGDDEEDEEVVNPEAKRSLRRTWKKFVRKFSFDEEYANNDDSSLAMRLSPWFYAM